MYLSLLNLYVSGNISHTNGIYQSLVELLLVEWLGSVTQLSFWLLTVPTSFVASAFVAASFVVAAFVAAAFIAVPFVTAC